MRTDGLEPLHIPAEFWQRAGVLAALDERDMGALFRLVRKHNGASQHRIGAAVGIAQSYVSAVMSSGPKQRKVTAHDLFTRIADGLHMPDHARARLGVAPRTHPAPANGVAPHAATATSPKSLTPAEAPTAPPTQPYGHDFDVDLLSLTDALSRGTVSEHDLEYMERAIYGLAQRYPVAGPAAVWPAAAAHLARLHEIVARPQRLSVHRCAVVLIGLLSGIGGNIFIDLGQQQEAARYFALGRLAGHEANDNSLTAWVTAMESIAPFFDRSPHYAANLLDQAHELSMTASGHRRTAWISALRARAYAKIDPGTAQRALDTAFHNLDQAEAPHGTDFFDLARLHGLAGTTHLILGDPVTAAEMTTLALAERSSTDVKGRAILTLDLAAAHVCNEEPEQACRLVLDALSTAHGQLVEPILTRALHVAASMAIWGTLSTVQQVNETLRTLTSQPRPIGVR